MCEQIVRIIVTLVVTIGLFCPFIRAESSDSARRDKYAEYGDFTHQVSLRDTYDNHQCAGSLLSDRWAVGVAECAYTSIELMAVGVFTLREADIYVLDTIKAHEQFDSSTNDNNIALFRTNREIQLGPFTQPIPYLKGDIDACDANLVAVGWSYMNDGFNRFALSYENMTAINNEECAPLVQDYVVTLHSTSICAVAKTGTFDGPNYFCYNSMMGLPLSSSDSRILIGTLTSQGYCDESTPLIATRISDYADWIAQITEIIGVDAI